MANLVTSVGVSIFLSLFSRKPSPNRLTTSQGEFLCAVCVRCATFLLITLTAIFRLHQCNKTWHHKFAALLSNASNSNHHHHHHYDGNHLPSSLSLSLGGCGEGGGVVVCPNAMLNQQLNRFQWFGALRFFCCCSRCDELYYWSVEEARRLLCDGLIDL